MINPKESLTDFKVYVVIVTYNAAPWLKTCLDSLRNSMPCVIVVIDNKSQDNTIQIIKSHYPEVILFESEENLGFGKANNIGISYALKQGAQYMLLLNQDAWLEPETLESLMHISASHPEYFILSPLHLAGDGLKLDYNFCHYISSSGKDLLSDILLNSTTKRKVYEVDFVNAAIWFMPREAFIKIGGFDPLFPHYGEDTDYVNRVRYHGYKVGVCPDLKGYHDRKQEPFNLEKFTPSKRRSWRKITYLFKLKNINHSFGKSMMSGISYFKTNCISSLKKFKLRGFASELFVLLQVLSMLGPIWASRKICKKKNGPFL